MVKIHIPNKSPNRRQLLHNPGLMLTSLLTLQAIYTLRSKQPSLPGQYIQAALVLKKRKHWKPPGLITKSRTVPIHTIKSESRVFAGTTLCNSLLSASCSRAWHSLCGQAARSLLVLRDGASCTDPSLPWAPQVRQLPWPPPGRSSRAVGAEGSGGWVLSLPWTQGERSRAPPEPGSPFPTAWVSGSTAVPIQWLLPALLFSLWALLASSCAAVLSTSEGTFHRKVKLAKVKIVECILSHQRDSLWLANRHEIL